MFLISVARKLSIKGFIKENNTVSLDLGAANEDGKINEQLKLLEGAIEKKCIVHRLNIPCTLLLCLLFHKV